MANPQAS